MQITNADKLTGLAAYYAGEYTATQSIINISLYAEKTHSRSAQIHLGLMVSSTVLSVVAYKGYSAYGAAYFLLGGGFFSLCLGTYYAIQAHLDALVRKDALKDIEVFRAELQRLGVL
jgi:hypothetical protein